MFLPLCSNAKHIISILLTSVTLHPLHLFARTCGLERTWPWCCLRGCWTAADRDGGCLEEYAVPPFEGPDTRHRAAHRLGGAVQTRPLPSVALLLSPPIAGKPFFPCSFDIAVALQPAAACHAVPRARGKSVLIFFLWLRFPVILYIRHRSERAATSNDGERRRCLHGGNGNEHYHTPGRRGAVYGVFMKYGE